MQFQVFSSLDPAFNLALEEQLFLSLPPEHPGLFLLWQNEASIIVGRHQCTVEEVNEALVKKRKTAGGEAHHRAAAPCTTTRAILIFPL